MANNLTGQFDLANATEGTPLPSDTDIASFTDGTTSDTTGNFTASIDWGDGATTTGTVVGSNGSFTVQGGPHTYADDNTYPAIVTVTRNTDNATLTMQGGVAVSDADNLSGTGGPAITANPNQALNNVVVATFSNNGGSGFQNVPSDFTVNIDWGDGTTTAGVLSYAGGTYTVKGSHTYTTAGQFTISTFMNDDTPDTAVGFAQTQAGIGFGGTATPPTDVAETVTIPTGTQVATFVDNSNDPATDYTATINWGDGTTTAGSVSGGSGSYTVTSASDHTYADEGLFTEVVTIIRTTDSTTIAPSGTVTVAESDSLTASGSTIAGSLALSNVTVATFSDSNTANVAGDFVATIDWGDGTSSAGTVSGSGGAFTVTGSHTYAHSGQDTLLVNIADDPANGQSTASDSAESTANVGITSGIGASINATEAAAIPAGTQVATFADANSSDTASAFTATINWGDGATTTGTVSGSNGSFTVNGGPHTYADEGHNSVTTTVTRTADGETATVVGQATVVEADSLTAHGTSFTTNTHQVFTGTVATFDDTGFPGNVPGDFTAAIDWGDGQTTAGTVSGGSGSAFTVSGSHVYAAAGQDTVKVTLADDAPGTASATANSTATVNQGTSIPYDFNGDAISDLVFQNEAFNAGSGTPQIWLWNGTAVTSQMTYPNPGADWHVITSRDLNGDGKADLIWQSSSGQPGIWLMNGTTPIAEVGLTNPGPSWHVVASGDTNGDGKSDLIWQNTDGTLGVWLMNGTTPTAEAGIGNPGSNWKVVGAADYNGDGNDDILLQDTNTGNLTVDLMNGTTITSSVSITVGDPSWHAASTGEFNGQAEIAWQNNNGTLGIWLMNGTTQAAEAGLSNPGVGWQLISIDHFTPNGQADLLLQNTNGAMMLWEMNGTSVAAQLNLPNPGTGWQSENGHPFAVG